jgi:hypothetical protein
MLSAIVGLVSARSPDIGLLVGMVMMIAMFFLGKYYGEQVAEEKETRKGIELFKSQHKELWNKLHKLSKKKRDD